MTNPSKHAAMHSAMNVLAKWRSLFAGWQLGTRVKGDPECDAVRDHREVTILLRAEMNALAGLMLKKGVFSEDEWADALIEESKMLNADYERKFPGVRASEVGLHFGPEAAEWMKHWKP